MEKNHGEDHGYTMTRIKELRAIHKREVSGLSDAAQNLRDEASIFVDILPGYKIKELTDQEKSQMKSKDVRNLQAVEQKILMYYRKFLGQLVGLAHKKSEDAQYIALTCLCEILPAAQDFNFGSSVIDTIVNSANSRHPRLANMCVSSVRTILSAPHPTEAVLSALQYISDCVKDRGHGVNHRLLASLVCVRIRVMDVHARDIVKEKKIKKQQKKEDKELAKILEKGQASVGRVELLKLQTNMLNKVITTFLRTLEVCKTAPRYRQSMLFGPVMEGLAKFAPMIDFSLFELLLQAIRDVLETDGVTTAAMMNGIITVAILANNSQKDSTSEGVAIDIAPYYEKLYTILPFAFGVSSQHDERSRIDEEQQFDEAGRPTDDVTTAVSMVAPRGRKSDPPRNTLKERLERSRLALRALDLMLLQPKKVPQQRVAAFFRRLELLSGHTPPHVSLGILAFCRRLLQKYTSLATLHDGGEEAAGGAYDYECEVPDHVNAMSSVSWDLNLHRQSYHPTVREYASAMLKQHKGLSTNSQRLATLHSTLMGINFDEVVKGYDISTGGFKPAPLEVNRKMDRATLKRRQQALLQAENEERLASAKRSAELAELENPQQKKRKIVAAIEEG